MFPVRLSLVTYNLWNTRRWPERAPALEQFVRLFDPDVLCLQELRPETLSLLDAALPGHRRVHDDSLPGWTCEGNVYWRGELLQEVEHGVGVSNRISSFVLPIGATVNMDGTALYECVAVIFVAQVYAAANPEFTLTVGAQLVIVFLALMVSIGAAGIPHAGLVMMVIIFKAIGIPIELAGLLWAVDRPLDMCRTVVNLWSDSMGTVTIAHTEGEIDDSVLFKNDRTG